MEGNPGEAAPADRPDPPRFPGRSADDVRVSDAERDEVISQLCERYAEGRLTHDTLSQRVDAALRARHRHDLAAIVSDLPRRRRLSSVLQACWQRGRAVLASAVPRVRGMPPVRPAAPLPVLVFPSGEQRRFTIGRDTGCDMVLGDPTVSRWHAGLEREADGWLLDDLGSTNGTRLNGWRVRAAVPVRHGDLVSFGAVTFVVGPATTGRTAAWTL